MPATTCSGPEGLLVYARHHAAAGHPTSLYLFAPVPPKSPRPDRRGLPCRRAALRPRCQPGPRSFPMSSAQDKALVGGDACGTGPTFARTGDPNGGADAAWPGFDADDPHWMRFDHSCVAEPVDRRDKYELLNRRIARVLGPSAAG